MDSLVHQLLFDLHQRSRFLSDQLTRLAGKLPTDAESYRGKMANRAERTADLIQSMLSDPGLQHPQLAKNFFHAYKRLAELLHEIESGPLLALKHFDNGEWLITRLVSAICTEVGFPDSPAGICIRRMTPVQREFDSCLNTSATMKPRQQSTRGGASWSNFQASRDHRCMISSFRKICWQRSLKKSVRPARDCTSCHCGINGATIRIVLLRC